MSQLSRPTSAASTALNEPVTSSKPYVDIVLHEDKQCKNSVRYGTKDPESPVTSIYLMRSFAERMPKSIVVTITAK